MKDERVSLELTKSEAIVLFEFLVRFNGQGNNNIFEDQAEQKMLWDIEAILEKQLSEPFRADYSKIISKAREQVRSKE